MPLPLPSVLPDSTVMKRLCLPAFEERRAVVGAGEVGHRADVQLVGDHLVGQRRAGREVLPLDVVGHVLVLAVARQVLLQQLQLADQQAAGGAVDRRVLRADGDADGLGGVRRRAARRSTRPAKADRDDHGLFSSFVSRSSAQQVGDVDVDRAGRAVLLARHAVPALVELHVGRALDQVDGQHVERADVDADGAALVRRCTSRRRR